MVKLKVNPEIVSGEDEVAVVVKPGFDAAREYR